MRNSYLKMLPLIGLLIGASHSRAQSDYSVTSIPSQVYSAVTVPITNADDTWSDVIPLTFNFNFFGNTYNQMSIGSNGVITFDPVELNSYCPWPIPAGGSIPSPDIPIQNAVFGCFHDINNAVMPYGSVSYGVLGTAPYRRFVIFYDNIAHFSCGPDYRSSFQIILYETLNIIDSQIIEKDICDTWNGGAAIVGIENADGTIAFAPPGRNGGQWIGDHEGWRFTPPLVPNTYNYTICDDNADGFGNFDLTIAQNALWAANPSGVSFYASMSDLNSQTNSLPLTYSNINAGDQTIYALISGTSTNVVLRVIDCNSDYDSDTVANTDEDLNGNGNLDDDDTDADGIPNFIDNDDDGDLVLTNIEYAFGGRNQNSVLATDTDNDGIPNYLDNDDDNDGLLTINEDYNGNHNPSDDDTNSDGTPDYLQSTVLNVDGAVTTRNSISIYPNPANDVLNIDNRTGTPTSSITIYSVSGRKIAQYGKLEQISVSGLQAGIYFVKVSTSEQTFNYKLIKK